MTNVSKSVFSATVGGLLLLTLTGCVTPIGKEDFTCPNAKKGGICGGPRDIMRLTDNARSVEEALHQQEHDHTQPKGEMVELQNQTVYYPRTMNQPTGGQQPAIVVEGMDTSHAPQIDGYASWPNQGEPIAPEPLAVVEQPRMLRILVAKWKDRAGNLHMPGYIYKDVTKRTLKFGRQADTRPTRAIPYEMTRTAETNLEQQRQRGQGVDGLGVQTKLGDEQ